VQNDYGIYGVGHKVITVFMTAVSQFPIKSCGTQTFDALYFPAINNSFFVFAGPDRSPFFPAFCNASVYL